MTASSSNALTRIEHVPSNSPIATLLRRILEWMDTRHVVVVELPAPEVPAETQKQIEVDDGLLKPKDIADKVSALLWAHRGSLDVSLDYDEAVSGRGYHSKYVPTATITLPGGIQVIIRDSHYSRTTVVAPDGQRQDIKMGLDTMIARVWECLQALAAIEMLGLDDLLPADPEDDGTTPSFTVKERLAEALGRYVERRAPVQCTGTFLKVHYIEETKHRASSTRETRDPSAWSDVSEGVLLQMEAKTDYNGKAQPPIALLSHPVMGRFQMPGAAIQFGLDRRTSTSLAEALGMALELPAHLPMPRGNAQAARVLRLCREAVAAEPDLTDAAGTPIRPLVDQHLPELMRRHAAASAIAPDSDLAGIDADLMTGIDRVKKAVEEALSCSAVARRQALKSQLGFLELRHPDPVPLLESIPSRPSLDEAA